jgi:NADH-quinone oxidoreductase subunit I
LPGRFFFEKGRARAVWYNETMTIQTKVLKRPEMNFWQKIYLPEIGRGLLLTASHFWRNLFLHGLHAVGLFRDVPAAVTISYPEEQRPVTPRARTRHRLTKRSDGSPRCVACMMCETVCPARCIYIRAEEHPDPTVEKRPKSFVIDLGTCVYCGFCVEACPEDAIRMDTQILDVAAFARKDMILDMDELLNPNPRHTSIQPSL